jgi:hypothetical protein
MKWIQNRILSLEKLNYMTSTVTERNEQHIWLVSFENTAALQCLTGGSRCPFPRITCYDV